MEFNSGFKGLIVALRKFSNVPKEGLAACLSPQPLHRSQFRNIVDVSD